MVQRFIRDCLHLLVFRGHTRFLSDSVRYGAGSPRSATATRPFQAQETPAAFNASGPFTLDGAVPMVLALAIETSSGKAIDYSRDPRSDSAHGAGEPSLGSAENSRRTAEVRLNGRREHCRLLSAAPRSARGDGRKSWQAFLHNHREMLIRFGFRPVALRIRSLSAFSFRSRSRTTYRYEPASGNASRSCWITHSAHGCAVTFACRIRLRSCSMAKKGAPAP